MILKEPGFNFLDLIQMNRIVSHSEIFVLENQTQHTLLESENELICNLYFILEGAIHYGNKVYGKNSIFGMKFIKKKNESPKQLRHQIYALDCTFGYIEIP